MDSYQYAKDNRTDEKYLADVVNGWKREAWVAKNLGLKIKLTKEKLLTDGNWSYEPDGIIKLKEGWFPLEIKVARYKPQYFDLKKNQVDQLYKINGLILYVAKDEWTLIKASLPHRIGIPIGAEDSKVNHEAYRMTASEFKWNKIKRDQA